MNHIWFKRVAIFFIPVSAAGRLILAGAIAYLIHVLIDTNRRSGSDTEKMLAYVINFIIVFTGYTVVGYFTSKKDRDR